MGFGHRSMASEAEAEEAIKQLIGKEVDRPSLPVHAAVGLKRATRVWPSSGALRGDERAIAAEVIELRLRRHRSGLGVDPLRLDSPFGIQP